MAGIGLELRKMLRRHTYTGNVMAYSYATMVSSGPWLLSIFGILILNLLYLDRGYAVLHTSQFITTLTYLISASLILSGFLQLAFTRYVADRVYLKELEAIVPNFNGALLIVTITSGTIGFLFSMFFLSELSLLYRVLFYSSFVILCDVWHRMKVVILQEQILLLMAAGC